MVELVLVVAWTTLAAAWAADKDKWSELTDDVNEKVLRSKYPGSAVLKTFVTGGGQCFDNTCVTTLFAVLRRSERQSLLVFLRSRWSTEVDYQGARTPITQRLC